MTPKPIVPTSIEGVLAIFLGPHIFIPGLGSAVAPHGLKG